MNRKPTRFILVAGFVGVMIAIIARQPLLEFLRGQPIPPPPPQIKLPPSPDEIAKPHLSWADQECERIIGEHVKTVDAFILDRKKYSRAFADEALSFGSKWRLIVDYVPFTSGTRHEAFIRGKFEEHVFKPQQLEDVVKQVVASYLKHVESVEGKMLVRIRADIAGFPAAYVISQIDESKVRASYDEALKRAFASSGSSLRTDVATELVSFIAGEVLTQVAVRLGVSGGVLGTGAASSWATLGIGFVVGVIVDQLISMVWDWYADPRGSLANELNTKLDEINHLIVAGSTDVTGLRDRLKTFAKERSELRKTAVLSILQPQQ